jgi:hypothetical protein
MRCRQLLDCPSSSPLNLYADIVQQNLADKQLSRVGERDGVDEDAPELESVSLSFGLR